MPLYLGSYPPFRARLACVRHAASVDSEPGSNSPVEILTTPRRTRQSCSLESISLKLFSVALLQQGTEVRQVLDPVFKEPAPVSGLILWGAESLLSSLVARLAPWTRERNDTEGIRSCQPLLRRKSSGFFTSQGEDGDGRALASACLLSRPNPSPCPCPVDWLTLKA